MGVSSFDTLSTKVATGVAAFAGGGQAGATPLLFGTTGANTGGGQVGAFSVDTVATAADSVKLPPSDGSTFSVPVGAEIDVVNTSANSMQVFGSNTDTINAVATATGVAHAAGKYARYKLFSRVNGVGAWFRLLSA